MGHEFVSLLTGEVTLLSRDEAKSEHLIMCMNVMLQRDVMIHRAADIRRLLKRHMEMWRENRFDELTCKPKDTPNNGQSHGRSSRKTNTPSMSSHD